MKTCTGNRSVLLLPAKLQHVRGYVDDVTRLFPRRGNAYAAGSDAQGGNASLTPSINDAILRHAPLLVSLSLPFFLFLIPLPPP